MKTCIFCNLDHKKIENTILEETKYFYVIPSLGSLVDGYILIVSKKHKNSMSNLNCFELKEYISLIDKYRNIFKEIYHNYPIVFEHGTPNISAQMKANSINHAHTHIVNHIYKDQNNILKQNHFQKLDDIMNISKNNNYIFYIDNLGNKYITYNFQAESQLMRILIVNDLNIYNSTDWKKYDFKENILKTIEKIKEREKK